MQIAICDDDPNIIASIRSHLAEANHDKADSFSVLEYSSIPTLLQAVQIGVPLDLLYLDIEVGTDNGVAAAKQIRRLIRNILIIFVSSHPKYYHDAFDARPFQFINKPIDAMEFHRVLQDALAEYARGNLYLSFSYQRSDYRIPVRDIVYIEVQNKTAFIHMYAQDKQFVCYESISSIIKRLPQNRFLHIHAAFCVNCQYILCLSATSVLLQTGQTLPLARSKREAVILALHQYKREEDRYVL